VSFQFGSATYEVAEGLSQSNQPFLPERKTLQKNLPGIRASDPATIRESSERNLRLVEVHTGQTSAKILLSFVVYLQTVEDNCPKNTDRQQGQKNHHEIEKSNLWTTLILF
jgi:hypothetical protein